MPNEEGAQTPVFSVLLMLLGFEPFVMDTYVRVLKQDLGYNDAKVKATSFETVVRDLCAKLQQDGCCLNLVRGPEV